MFRYISFRAVSLRFITSLLFLSVSLLPALPFPALAEPEPSAQSIVRAARDLMNGGAGGEPVAWLKAEGETYKNLLEQSEHADGPWIKNRGRFVAEADIGAGRIRYEARDTVLVLSDEPYGPPADILVTPQAAGVRLGQAPEFRTAPTYYRQMATGFLRAEPYSVLKSALAAEDLVRQEDAVLQQAAHAVLAFTHGQTRYRLYINQTTGLPTAVDRIADFAGSTMLNAWGDVTVRTLYSFWWTTENGRHYPKQWDTFINGRPWISRAIASLALDAEPPEPDRLEFSADVRGRLADAALPGPETMDPPAKGTNIAPGLVQYQGRWNVLVVDQGDGLVVLDAPISSAYSAKVIERLAQHFDGAAIKAVVTTSDAWPHMGGVREYAGRGVAVYHLDVNAGILGELLAAPRTHRQDSLSASPDKGAMHSVSSPLTVGDGNNRFRLIPIRGASLGRMMMAYFPEHRLLYTSDAIILDRDGSIFPHVRQYVFEVAQAVCRHDLAVDSVVGFHIPVTDWAAVRDRIANWNIGACTGQ